MKILVTSYGFLTPSMTFIYNQITELESQGHEIIVVACERLNQHLFPFEKVNVFKESKDLNYIISALKRKLGISFSYNSNNFSSKFKSLVESFKPDVVHCHFGTHFFRIWPTLKHTNIPVLITFHGYDASVFLGDKTYCKSLRKAFTSPNVYAAAVSDALKIKLLKIGLPEDKIIVDYLGVDTLFFKREVPREFGTNEPAHFLQISNFVEKKGHEYTIMAFRRYLDTTGSNDVLVFGGDGPLYDAMVKLSEDLNLQENIQFFGLVDRFQVKELMTRAHFFVHHSVTASNGDTEGLPTVLMEAMAMDLPCISTYHSGIPELIEDGINGILNKERDIEGLSNAFSEIKGIANNQRELIVEKFNLEINTHTIGRILKDITEHNAI